MSNGTYLAEYENSRSILGAEDNYDANWTISNNFKGYFYEFKIFNDNISTDSDITNLVTLEGTGCPNDWGNCQAC